MLNEKLAKLLNEQVNAEFYSAYLYLDFANCATSFLRLYLIPSK